MEPAKKFFSLQEAQAALPEVKDRIERIFPICQRIQQRQAEMAAIAAQNANNSGGPEATAYVQDLLVLQKYLADIGQLGVIVKDFQRGLVDFPYDRKGREVYLCWEYGEDTIRFWHEVEDGYAGRRPVEEL